MTALTIAAIATAFGTSTALAIYAGGIIVWRRIFGSGSRAIINGRADRKALNGQASPTVTVKGQADRATLSGKGSRTIITGQSE